MITPNKEMLDAAIAAHSSEKNPDSAIGDWKKEMIDRTTLDVSENIFEEGDTFTFPANEEEMLKVIVKDTYKNLPKIKRGKRAGEYPSGFSVLVFVKNEKTGAESVKKFRASSASAGFNEYAFDPVNEVYVSTGNRVENTNNLCKTIRSQQNLWDSFACLYGKTLKVKTFVSGNAPVFDDRGVVISIKRRDIPVWEETA